MPDPHYVDVLTESYREESSSLAATVARLLQENRQLREDLAVSRALSTEYVNANHQLRNQVSRLRAGGKA